ncbi:MAG: nitrous oxide reductase family maturation protein NosD [Cyclobacteriaceae bacterium]|nr:MAG: nitrous oxide reductase family maturation protein NosD [Cyclobacteriaceae bacterium]
MKDYIRYSILCLFTLLLLPATANIIVVQSGGKISSIRSAIAQANAGDTIRVKAGTYREGNILITKPLVLIGEGKPVVDGEHKVEVFTVEAEHVTIEGFQITNSGVSSMKDLAGIGSLQGNFLVVRNNEFIATFFGVHISNAKHVIVEGNTFRASLRADHETGNGIHLWQCANATIRNNTINGHRDGIYFEFVTNSLISGNTSEKNNRYGLHFMFSHDDEYRDNIFRNNGAGVAVMYTKNVTMVNNIFDRNWGPTAYGLLLKDIRDSHIIGNRFDRNTIAIYMEGSSRSEFKKNTFVGNGWAVKLQASCDDNTFSENNFTSNTFDLSTNGTMVLNKIDRNYWDKYQGYDLNKDGVGDVPFRPVNMYAMVVERIPTAVLLWRSFLVFLLDRAEKVFPAVTPENLKDDYPSMKPYDLS